MPSVLKSVLGASTSIKSNMNFRWIGHGEENGCFSFSTVFLYYNSLSTVRFLCCLIIDFRRSLSQARPKRFKRSARQEQVQCRAGLPPRLCRSPRARRVEEIALVQAQPCRCGRLLRSSRPLDQP